MPKTVHKYRIPATRQGACDRMILPGPPPRVLEVGMQGAGFYFWAEVDLPERTTSPASAVEVTEIEIGIYPTGEPIPARLFHLATVFDDPFVWHVYWDVAP